MNSWKTTVCGIGAILAAIGTIAKLLFDGDPMTNPDYAVLVPAILAGFGMIFARDNSKTSEAAGAK